MSTSPNAGARDARQFATPNTPAVQNENTVDAPTVDAANDQQATAPAGHTEARDDRAQRDAAPRARPEHNTSEWPQPGDGRQAVDTPPVNPNGDLPDPATQGEALEATPAVASPATEARIERDLAAAARTGEVPPRSSIAPAKPARPPSEAEQRMADDFDPPPLAHRPEVADPDSAR